MRKNRTKLKIILFVLVFVASAIVVSFPLIANLNIIQIVDEPVYTSAVLSCLVILCTLMAGVFVMLLRIHRLDRQKMEETTNYERYLLHALMDNLPDSIYFKDKKSRFLHVNKAQLERFGLVEQDQVIGKTDADFFSMEHAQSALADEHEIMKTGTPLIGKEEKEIWADGRVGWVSTSKVPLRDSKGTIVGTFGVSRDITGKKQAEEALRDANEQLSLLLESLPVAVYRFTPDEPLVGSFFLNQNIVAMTGFTPADFAASNQFWIERVHPQDMDRVWSDLETLMAKGFLEHEYRWKCADGTYHWIADYQRAVRVPGQSKYHIVGMWQDITERKKADTALENSESLYHSLVENLQQNVIRKDREGHFTFANTLFCEMAQISQEDLLGKTDFDLFPHELAEQYRRDDMQVMETGVVLEREESHVKADGSKFFVQVFKAPLYDAHHNCIGIQGIFWNITEKKLAEEKHRNLQEQLNQAQKMESVGRLAGGVAHDFNNMLGVILGHTEMAMDDIDSTLPVYKDLLEIQKAAMHSADLTRQLLAFARRQPINPKVLNLNHSIDDMCAMLRRLIGEDVDLVWKPGPNIWPIKVDPSQIDQILINLCVNARDAITGNGNITIETNNAIVDETYCATHAGSACGEYVVLAVSDTGVGMDKSSMEHLFEPFYTTKELGKGTGLGLATVYGAVKQNNGFIYVYSEPGEGTSFKIYLPRANVFEHEQLDAAKKAPRGTETILLTEDEKSILKLGKTILERHGYKVLAANSPVEALNLSQNHEGPIDLLITDVVMPGMNGKELQDRMAAQRPQIKTLFMSGYTANVIAHHGVINEGIEFLQKPFTVNALTQKVRQILD